MNAMIKIKQLKTIMLMYEVKTNAANITNQLTIATNIFLPQLVLWKKRVSRIAMPNTNEYIKTVCFNI